jgi:hypothetical protein
MIATADVDTLLDEIDKLARGNMSSETSLE